MTHWIRSLAIAGLFILLALAVFAWVGDTAEAGKGGRRGHQSQLIVAPTCAVDTSFTLAAGASEQFELSGCEAFTQFAFYSQFAHPGQETTPFDATETDQQLTVTDPSGAVLCCADDHDDTLDFFYYAQAFPMEAGVWVFTIQNHGQNGLQMSVLAGGQ